MILADNAFDLRPELADYGDRFQPPGRRSCGIVEIPSSKNVRHRVIGAAADDKILIIQGVKNRFHFIVSPHLTQRGYGTSAYYGTLVSAGDFDEWVRPEDMTGPK